MIVSKLDTLREPDRLEVRHRLHTKKIRIAELQAI